MRFRAYQMLSGWEGVGGKQKRILLEDCNLTFVSLLRTYAEKCYFSHAALGAASTQALCTVFFSIHGPPRGAGTRGTARNPEIALKYALEARKCDRFKVDPRSMGLALRPHARARVNIVYLSEIGDWPFLHGRFRIRICRV